MGAQVGADDLLGRRARGGAALDDDADWVALGRAHGAARARLGIGSRGARVAHGQHEDAEGSTGDAVVHGDLRATGTSEVLGASEKSSPPVPRPIDPRRAVAAPRQTAEPDLVRRASEDAPWPRCVASTDAPGD